VLALFVRPHSAFGQGGTITGRVVDASSVAIAHATVTLSHDDGRPDRETTTTEIGEFTFAGVDAGRYRLVIAADGFAPATITGDLRVGQSATLSPTVLAVAFRSEIDVTPSSAALAEAQIKDAETQRIVGVFPNFYVNYDGDAAPLNARQKLELSWKSFIDPTVFVTTFVGAGIAQARNTNPGFGRGAQGYVKRYAADYGEFATSQLIAKVVMPTVFKQDPRYFYKGTGTTRSRVVYALSRSVICRGDDRQPQVCYSSLLGRLASGAITNLYLPPSDRNTTRVILDNAVIAIGGNAGGNLLQEFVAKRFTRKKKK